MCSFLSLFLNSGGDKRKRQSVNEGNTECPFAEARASFSLPCDELERFYGCGRTRFCRAGMRVCRSCSLTTAGLSFENYAPDTMHPGKGDPDVNSPEHFHFCLEGDPCEFRCRYCPATFSRSAPGLLEAIEHAAVTHSTFKV